MKLDEITIDTPLGLVFDAIERGDFSRSEFYALFHGRLDQEHEERKGGANKAIEAVKAFENRKSPRVGYWYSKFVRLGDLCDGPGVYLVKCGQSAWHVDPKTFQVRVVPR